MNNLQTKIEEQLINADGVSRQVDLLDKERMEIGGGYLYGRP